ncbi:MAG: class II aldolase/adducin family protein [Phycisphaerae bacterium]|nr:class II aldolase/adducin family protein [Phycisphaerae bacterium]
MNAEPSSQTSNVTEAAVRLQVAACYRLIHLYGLSDFTDGFVSARIPSEPRHVIVGGYGLSPELAGASGLHKRSLDVEPELEKFVGVDIDAINFTKTVLDARPTFNACIHAHPRYGIALSAVDLELEPMSQWGIMYHGLVRYLPFETTDVTAEESCVHIGAASRNGAEALIMRNHGFLVGGRTIQQALFTLHRLELACQLQLDAIQTGLPRTMPSPKQARELREAYWTMTRVDNDGTREWPGLMAKLDRLDRSYRD